MQSYRNPSAGNASFVTRKWLPVTKLSNSHAMNLISSTSPATTNLLSISSRMTYQFSAHFVVVLSKKIKSLRSSLPKTLVTRSKLVTLSLWNRFKPRLIIMTEMWAKLSSLQPNPTVLVNTFLIQKEKHGKPKIHTVATIMFLLRTVSVELPIGLKSIIGWMALVKARLQLSSRYLLKNFADSLQIVPS